MSAVLTSGIEAVRADVDAFLARYYRQQAKRAGGLHEDYAVLWQSIENAAGRGGKRIRPYVMLVAYQGLGGREYNAVLPVAVALEVLHASMLIHDDIIDRDYVRYGRPNVAGQYRERYQAEALDETEQAHYANAAALLAGDLTLSGAYGLILDSALTAEQKVAAAGIVHDIIFAVAGGELLDTEAPLLPFEGVDTLVIAQLKTAAYSFIYPLHMAAMLTNAPPAARQKLEAFGIALGIAYQLADDILGLFGDESVTGKTVTGDIAEGKRTYLMQTALRLATPEQRSTLEAAIGRGAVTAEQAVRVRSIVRESGALAEMQALISRYADEARTALRGAGLEGSAETALFELIDKATRRNK